MDKPKRPSRVMTDAEFEPALAEALRDHAPLFEALAPFDMQSTETIDDVRKERDRLREHFRALDDAQFASSFRCVACKGAVLPGDQTPAGYLCRHCGPGTARDVLDEVRREMGLRPDQDDQKLLRAVRIMVAVNKGREEGAYELVEHQRDNLDVWDEANLLAPGHVWSQPDADGIRECSKCQAIWTGDEEPPLCVDSKG